MTIAEAQRDLLVDWIEMLDLGGRIDGFFFRKNIHSVILYGAGELGRKLYDSLAYTEIEVKYAIDKVKAGIGVSGAVYHPDNVDISKDCADAIVVTAIMDFPEIYDFLKDKFVCSIPIYGIQDLIYDEILFYKK